MPSVKHNTLLRFWTRRGESMLNKKRRGESFVCCWGGRIGGGGGEGKGEGEGVHNCLCFIKTLHTMSVSPRTPTTSISSLSVFDSQKLQSVSGLFAIAVNYTILQSERKGAAHYVLSKVRHGRRRRGRCPPPTDTLPGLHCAQILDTEALSGR